jgi:3'-phosphoadenosine 5'-phosphosulfate sulfotransferase (PAPS reductase)/FAD synthetase
MNDRVIVAFSGGKASAWCANWAFNNYQKEKIILYFNDTKWEHPDLYRFLNDMQTYFNHRIFFDSDGRSPEDLFYANNALANNRMPFCSRVLKAVRLQKFYNHGDTIIFGIGSDEPHRGRRIIAVYNDVAKRKGKWPILRFPLIGEHVTNSQINEFIKSTGIEEPLLYKLGFSHNNCSGGCVRAGKKHWKLLYEKLPEVYADRERVEREVRQYLQKDVSFFKDETLEQFRGRIERKELSSYYYDKEEPESDCIGICANIA